MVPPQEVHTQKRLLRQLLPAERRSGEDQSSGEGVDMMPKPKALSSGHVPVACATCRRLKVKCSGERPKCGSCVRRKKTCEYEYDVGENKTRTQALKRKYNDLESQYNVHGSIFDALRSRPEPEALAIFQQIRSGTDPATILQHIQHGDLLLQLSTGPEAKYCYDLPFLAGMPSLLQRPANPYLTSSLSELTLQPSLQPKSPIQE